MAGDSPAAILFDANGNEIALADGYSITVDTKGIPIIIINDSGDAKFVQADADGYLFATSRINEELPAGTNIIGKIGVDPANTGGLALETTQQTLATENTLIDAYNKLDSLEAKDFATETTLIDSYNKLDSLEAKDFATETTMQTLATEATLIDSYNKLDSLEAKDFATETTQQTLATEDTLIDAYNKLDSLEAKDFATEATLSSIKDTDGIKKITDALPIGDNVLGRIKLVDGFETIVTTLDGYSLSETSPGIPILTSSPTNNAQFIQSDDDGYLLTDARLLAGASEIGRVAQGTRADAYGGWPMYIVDDTGNKIGVIYDNGIYRLQSDSKVGDADGYLVHLETLSVDTEVGRLKATLYSPDGEAVAFSSVSANPESIKNQFVKDISNNESLLVDGSGTPQYFSYDADPEHDISLQEIKFVVSSNSITFGTGYFGGRSGPLPNGLLVEIVAGGNTGTVANLTRNECFIHFSSPGGFNWVVSSKDMMSSTYVLGGALKLGAGSSDKVRLTVRDNLTAAGVYFQCLVKGNILAA